MKPKNFKKLFLLLAIFALDSALFARGESNLEESAASHSHEEGYTDGQEHENDYRNPHHKGGHQGTSNSPKTSSENNSVQNSTRGNSLDSQSTSSHKDNEDSNLPKHRERPDEANEEIDATEAGVETKVAQDQLQLTKAENNADKLVDESVSKGWSWAQTKENIMKRLGSLKSTLWSSISEPLRTRWESQRVTKEILSKASTVTDEELGEIIQQVRENDKYNQFEKESILTKIEKRLAKQDKALSERFMNVRFKGLPVNNEEEAARLLNKGGVDAVLFEAPVNNRSISPERLLGEMVRVNKDAENRQMISGNQSGNTTVYTDEDFQKMVQAAVVKHIVQLRIEGKTDEEITADLQGWIKKAGPTRDAITLAFGNDSQKLDALIKRAVDSPELKALSIRMKADPLALKTTMMQAIEYIKTPSAAIDSEPSDGETDDGNNEKEVEKFFNKLAAEARAGKAISSFAQEDADNALTAIQAADPAQRNEVIKTEVEKIKNNEDREEEDVNDALTVLAERMEAMNEFAQARGKIAPFTDEQIESVVETVPDFANVEPSGGWPDDDEEENSAVEKIVDQYLGDLATHSDIVLTKIEDEPSLTEEEKQEAFKKLLEHMESLNDLAVKDGEERTFDGQELEQFRARSMDPAEYAQDLVNGLGKTAGGATATGEDIVAVVSDLDLTEAQQVAILEAAKEGMNQSGKVEGIEHIEDAIEILKEGEYITLDNEEKDGLNALFKSLGAADDEDYLTIEPAIADTGGDKTSKNSKSGGFSLPLRSPEINWQTPEEIAEENQGAAAEVFDTLDENPGDLKKIIRDVNSPEVLRIINDTMKLEIKVKGSEFTQKDVDFIDARIKELMKSRKDGSLTNTTYQPAQGSSKGSSRGDGSLTNTTYQPAQGSSIYSTPVTFGRGSTTGSDEESSGNGEIQKTNKSGEVSFVSSSESLYSTGDDGEEDSEIIEMKSEADAANKEAEKRIATMEKDLAEYKKQVEEYNQLETKLRQAEKERKEAEAANKTAEDNAKVTAEAEKDAEAAEGNAKLAASRAEAEAAKASELEKAAADVKVQEAKAEAAKAEAELLKAKVEAKKAKEQVAKTKAEEALKLAKELKIKQEAAKAEAEKAEVKAEESKAEADAQKAKEAAAKAKQRLAKRRKKAREISEEFPGNGSVDTVSSTLGKGTDEIGQFTQPTSLETLKGTDSAVSSAMQRKKKKRAANNQSNNQ